MSRVSASTDGGYNVETWIEDGSGETSQVSVGGTGISHVIKISQISTYVRNVNFKGSLPAGIGDLAFMRGGNQESEWGVKLKGMSGNTSQKRNCPIDVLGCVGQNERVQCSEISYEDVWSPGPSVMYNCTLNMPLETTVNIA